MARPVLKIKDLTEKSRFIKLEVRVTALWVVHSPPKTGHFEMIVMDSQGDEIQVGAKGDEYTEWVDKLEEKKTYVMENFKVVKNEEKFSACNHPYWMYFIGGTTLRVKDLVNMPGFQYKFANFQDIIDEKFSTTQLIDVIGVVQHINTSGEKMVALDLRDLSQVFIKCTIWDTYAKQFLEFWKSKKETDDSVVVILRRVRVKEKNLKYGISLSNLAYNNITQLITDQELEEIKEFKTKFGQLPIVEAVSELGMTQMSSFSQFDDKDKFMYKAKAMSLGMIMDIKPNEDISVVTVAEAVDFDYHKGGWYFDGCSSDKCGKKRLDHDSIEPYTYSCGRFNKVSVPRYKLVIFIKSNDSTTKVTFFDEQCNYVLGITAQDLRNEMLKLGEGDRKSYPMKLNKMLEKTYALRLKIQNKFSGLSVQKCSIDDDYIKTIQKQIEENEGISEIAKETKQTMLLKATEDEERGESSQEQCHETPYFPTQELSMMSENDPEKTNNITPSKRNSSESVPEESDDQLAASGQLSTNKAKNISLRKNIKKET